MPRDNRPRTALFTIKNLIASYTHLYSGEIYHETVEPTLQIRFILKF